MATKWFKIDKVYIIIAMTVLVAMALDILPIPDWTRAYWPHWTLLVTLYWCLAMPLKINIKFAWLVGLLTDILLGSWIGQHALVYTVAAYLAGSFYQLVRFYPPHQQIIPIMIVLLLCEMITLWMDGLRYGFEHIRLNALFSVFIGGLVWPWAFAVLRHLRQSLYTR